MAQTTYCPECAHKIEYTYPKPNFCPNCSYKFNGNIVTAQIEEKVATKSKPKLEAEVVSSRDTPKISKAGLGMEVESFGEKKGITFKELLEHPRKYDYVKPPTPKKVNMKEALKIFREEAGAGAKKVIEITDNSPE